MKNVLLAGAVILGMAAAGAASAQSINPGETVTVVPPFSTRQSTTPLKGGMKAQIIALNRYVDYGDLDLSKAQDRLEMQNRVQATARGACDALDAKFPQTVYVPLPESQDCVGNASRGALAMANISNDGLFTEE